MGIVNYTYNRSTSGGEIITHLINSTDGTGLHFDGVAGYIDIASPPDLGTKLSLEFIIQADSWPTSQAIVDFGNGGRLILGADSSLLAVYSGGWQSFGVAVLDDLKVHHLVMTVDGTSAILYDNGNQVGTATITVSDVDSCTDAHIGANYIHSGDFWDGTIYRTRFWNKTLTAAEVTASFENATVNFSDQYGSQTEVIDSRFTTGLSGWDAFNDWNSQTNPSNNMVLAASGAAQKCRTGTTLTAGKRYRCTYTASSVTDAPVFAFTNGGYTAITAAAGSSTITAGTNSFEFVWPAASSNDLFYILSVSATAAVTLDDIFVWEIGCVADYDLAFANPSPSPDGQSLMVRDRASAADGTSSTAGVVQITPIEQLNAKAARIGTSAATPADGELLVSGAVGVGTVPDANRMLHVKTTGTVPVQLESTTTYCQIGYKNSVASNCYLLFENTDFKIENGGATRLTISSTGNVGIGGAPATPSGLSRYLMVAGTTPGITIDETDNEPWEMYASGGTLKFLYNNAVTALSISSAGLATFANGINLGDENLDTYDEGTFVGTWSAATPPTTPPTATGTYVKVGKLVTFSIRFDSGDLTGASGAMKITGLPFTAGTDYTVGGGWAGHYLSFNTADRQVVWIAAGATQVLFYDITSGGAWSYMDTTAGTGKFLICSGTYITT